MTKLNLGCGQDVRAGYVNIDVRRLPGVDIVHDLVSFPWPFLDESVAEILMLDFFEHIPYGKNGSVIDESWRVLRPGGTLTIQVPDFSHSAAVIESRFPFVCNKCENEIGSFGLSGDCPNCSHPGKEMRQVAMQRLYGGQDYEGNWHFFSFTRESLREKLLRHGFEHVDDLEKDHQYRQWSLKSQFRKGDPW